MYWASRRVKERRTLPFSEVTKAAAGAALERAAGKSHDLLPTNRTTFRSIPTRAVGSMARKPGRTGAKVSWRPNVDLPRARTWRRLEGPRRALQQARRGTPIRRSGSRSWLRVVSDLDEVVGTHRRRHLPAGGHSGWQDHGHASTPRAGFCARSWLRTPSSSTS
jgi:hypothetical protein